MSLFLRVYEWIADRVRYLKGTQEERFFMDAQQLYERVLRDAARQNGKEVVVSVVVDGFGTQNGLRIDSNAVNADGTPKIVYHGSGAVFDEYAPKCINTHGSAEGRGFYLTDSRTMVKDGSLV